MINPNQRAKAKPLAACLTSLALVFLSVIATPTTANAAKSNDDAVTVAGGNGRGSAANQLAYPLGVATDGHGNIYVADSGNNRVQKWAPAVKSGATVAAASRAGEEVAADVGGDVFVLGEGPNPDQGSRDDIVVDRIVEWSPGATLGSTVAGGHGYGDGADQLIGPTAVAVDGHGNLFIADPSNNRVVEWMPGAAQGSTVASSAVDISLSSAHGLAVDSHDDVFVSEGGAYRVEEWLPGATRGTPVAGGNGAGTAANQIATPGGLAVDDRGDLFVADAANNRVQEWALGATQGVAVAGGNGAGSAANRLRQPSAVALDGDGYLYVADSGNDRIQRISLKDNPPPVEQAKISLTYYTTTSQKQAPVVRPGATVVLVAIVNAATAPNAVTGTVAFYDGPNALGSIVLHSYLGRSYAILFTRLAPGTHTITATYSGDDIFTRSSSNRNTVTLA